MSAFRGNASGAVLHGEFMAFVADEESLATIRQWAEKQGFPPATAQLGGPDMFAQLLEQGSPPKLAVVDIDSQSDPVSIAAKLAGLCGAECKLIAIGTANDVSLYRRMLGAGVVDYLVKPLTSETLVQAYAAVLRGGIAGRSETREARVIVLIGTRGGVGTSTIAINLGWIMAHDLKLQCALLDLDLQYGTSALALDLEPGRGLRDVVGSPHRVDSLMVASSMVVVSDQFSVMGAEESVEEVVPVDSSAITALLKEMRGNFDFIIVDLPRSMLATQKRLLAAAHEIVLVSELSLAGIRDTLRIKNALTAMGCAAAITLVASRVTIPGQVDPSAFEKGSQMKIAFNIPEDQKSITESSNTGKALAVTSPNAPVTRAMVALAARLSGKTAAEKGKGGSFLTGLVDGVLDIFSKTDKKQKEKAATKTGKA